MCDGIYEEDFGGHTPADYETMLNSTTGISTCPTTIVGMYVDVTNVTRSILRSMS